MGSLAAALADPHRLGVAPEQLWRVETTLSHWSDCAPTANAEGHSHQPGPRDAGPGWHAARRRAAIDTTRRESMPPRPTTPSVGHVTKSYVSHDRVT